MAIAHEGISANTAPVGDCPPPFFTSWEGYLARTPAEVIRYVVCQEGEPRGPQTPTIGCSVVQDYGGAHPETLITAKGRCGYDDLDIAQMEIGE